MSTEGTLYQSNDGSFLALPNFYIKNELNIQTHAMSG